MKKKVEPTPRPWKCNLAKHPLADETCGIVSEGGVSVCRAPRYVTRKQWEADGPLLASAPDLLEALEYSLPWLKSQQAGHKHIATTGCPYCLVICAVEAAINKAKGVPTEKEE